MLFGFRLLRVAMALTIIFCSSGCANLEDVAELSKVADSMRSSLPVVSEDIVATCERRGKLLADIPDKEKAPMDKPQDCAPFHSIADHVAADQNVLIAYLDALARLANH